MSADLSVIVVTHNSAEDLPVCLSSLFAHQGSANMRVVVSDAGSTDGTGAVAARYPVVYLAGDNRGFAAANNRALAYGDVADSRYVLFLNPDTEVLDGTLADLLGLCDNRPADGVFSVRQVNEQGAVIHSLFRFPRPLRYWLGVSQALRARSLGVRFEGDERYASECTFDWAIGAFLLVRGEVLRAVGWFDERFFLTSEEVDLCRRARLAGWGARYLPSFTIMHRYGGRPPNPWRAWILVDHQARYAQKWFSPVGHLLTRAALVVRHTRESLDRGVPAERRRESWFKVRAALGLPAPPREGAASPARSPGRGAPTPRPRAR